RQPGPHPLHHAGGLRLSRPLPPARPRQPLQAGPRDGRPGAPDMRRRAALLLLLPLSGCLVGPDYERPPPATPPTPEYKETGGIDFRPALPRDTVDRGPWWTIYGDSALDQLMAQVDVSNQTLKQNEAAYRQAVALIRQSQSGLYPTIGYTGSVTQNSSA